MKPYRKHSERIPWACNIISKAWAPKVRINKTGFPQNKSYTTNPFSEETA